MDGWLRLRGWARIGVLVSRLRGVIDRLIARRVENPGLLDNNPAAAATGSSSEIIRLVTRLVELDGLDA